MSDLVETRQNELKTKEICRFCLSQEVPNLTSIYTEPDPDAASLSPLAMQVMACASLEVVSNDSMPTYVCDHCRAMFSYFYRFKQMCKKADTSLRYYPLTGVWSAPMERPKFPEVLVRNLLFRRPQKNLNATIIRKATSKQDEIPAKLDVDVMMAMIMEPEENQIEKIDKIEEIESEPEELEPEPEPEPEPEAELKFQPKQKQQKFQQNAVEKPNQKLLNKSAIRILNKEAQVTIEPIMSKPVLKRDSDGNMAIVTEILDLNDIPPPADPKEKAAVVETNVFPCPHCERSFPLRQLLDIHMVNHNRERGFDCPNCEKSFFSKYDLQKHMLVHTGERPFKCVICGKGFTRSTLLHRHEKTHTDIPKFICVFCEKPFLSEKEMEKHTERHRKNRPFTCKICNKSFAFKQGLERHEVVHSRYQPFQCQYCDRSFSTPSKLSRHLTAHAGARPYPCKMCPKAYLLSHHLTRHMRSHRNGTGPYKCNDCDKTFSCRDDLIYHSAVHATQTLVCPLCKDAFEDIETVTDHVKQHAEGEAYACEFCDLIFMTADRLQEHTDDDHAEEMDAYNKDDQAAAEKKAKENTKDNDMNISNSSANPEFDEVIEELLYEEYSDGGENDKRTSIIVKEETDWQQETLETLEPEEGIISDEGIDYINIIEEAETIEEPPVKITKVSERVQKITKKVTPPLTPLRHKAPIKPAQPATHSNSSSPKENKKPILKQTQLTKIKVEVNPNLNPATPKTRQPTIQAALQGLPKSVSVKKFVPSSKTPSSIESKAAQSSSKAVEPSTPATKTTAASMGKKPAPKAATTPASISAAKQPPPPPTNTRPLRQRPEVSPNTKPPTKSPSVTGEIKKPSPKVPATAVKKAVSESLVGEKKIVEMMIGDKRVKVQKITMSKAQAAAMAREGRIQMKEGTMILKRDSNHATKVARKSK